MISHLCIGNLRTKKFTKLPETHPLEKDGRIGISGVPGQGRASRYGPLRKSVALLLAPPGHGDVMKVGTLADSGAEARVFSIWISRWVVEWISIDGWFSCSKTTDSAEQAIT